VLGGRVTNDDKSGDLVSGGVFVPGPNGFVDGTFTGVRHSAFEYNKTKPTYSIGLNYKPNSETLLYAKYGTAFVSGGSVADVAFDPETVESFELGAKADFFDRRLRTNLALFHATYEDQQSANSGSNVGRPDLSTLIINAGDRVAKGFELEVSALPVEGLTLNAGLGYTHVKLKHINPILVTSAGGTYVPTGIPDWTSNLSAQYETQPLFGDARLTFRADANWHSRRQNDENPNRVNALPQIAEWASTDPSWIVNGRISLHDIEFGPARAEVALWGRNLFNNREAMFPLRLQNVFSSTFVPARTYGVDVNFAF
jgi:iron complex outermembrane recepter protein